MALVSGFNRCRGCDAVIPDGERHCGDCVNRPTCTQCGAHWNGDAHRCACGGSTMTAGRPVKARGSEPREPELPPVVAPAVAPWKPTQHPTQVQAAAVGEMCRDAFNTAIANAERMGIPGAHALVVEWLGRTFAQHSDDMFRYAAPEDDE